MSYPFIVLEHLPPRSVSDPYFYYLRPFNPHYLQNNISYPNREPQILFTTLPLARPLPLAHPQPHSSPHSPEIIAKITRVMEHMQKHCSCFPCNGWPAHYSVIDNRLPPLPQPILPRQIRQNVRRKFPDEDERFPYKIKRLKLTQ